jgi:DNA replicative helicase MCM subunit Mcm2 (Cdc46/Mcm family)
MDMVHICAAVVAIKRTSKSGTTKEVAKILMQVIYEETISHNLSANIPFTFTKGRGNEDIQLIRALNKAREILSQCSRSAAVKPVYAHALTAVIGTGVRACKFAVEPRH